MKAKSLRTLLLEATHRKDQDQVRFLLRQNQIGIPDVATALGLAAHEGCTEIVKLLSNYPRLTEPDLAQGIWSAAKNGHEGIVRVLLEARPNVAWNCLFLSGTWLDEALQIAADRKDTQIVKLLLDAGANAGTAFYFFGLHLFDHPRLNCARAGLQLCQVLTQHPAGAKYRDQATEWLKELSERLNGRPQSAELEQLHATLGPIAGQFGVDHHPPQNMTERKQQ